MAIGDIIVGLDLGVSKVSCVVGQVNKFSEIEVIGYGLSKNYGIKKGQIVDPQNVALSIRKSIENAEEISGLSINSAYVNIKGMNVKIEKVVMEATVENPDDGLSVKDIQNLFSAVQMSTNLDKDEQIIDMIPYEYSVNDRPYKEEPIGAFCKKFSCKMDVVIARGTYINEVIKTLQYANLELDGLIIETLATSNIVLMPEEKDLGVLLVDMGAGHTDVSIYKKGELEYYTTIPVGGDHISNDIAITFDIGIEEAEKLKRQYNLAIPAMINNNHEIKLTSTMAQEDKDIIKCSDVVEVIQARVNEVYQIIYKLLEENKLKNKIECMVITGQGLSNIVGAEELAMLTLKINQVRICSPKLINVIKPQHTTVYGMVRYISGLGLGKHVNSDVEIITEATFKDTVKEKLRDTKEKFRNLYKRIKKEDKDE